MNRGPRTRRLLYGWIVLRGIAGSSFVAPPVVSPATSCRRFAPRESCGVEATSAVPYDFNEKAITKAVSSPDANLRARVADLVNRRARARWTGDYVHADALLSQLDDVVSRAGYSLRLTDTPRSQGGGSTWKLCHDTPLQFLHNDTLAQPSILHLAHAALGMAVSHSDRGLLVPTEALEKFVTVAIDQLRRWDALNEGLVAIRPSRGDNYHDFDVWTVEEGDFIQKQSREDISSWYSVEMELRGRTPADAAFWYALAGCRDHELFQLLAKICRKELRRFGPRPSCRSKDIMALASRLAAAGVRNDVELEETVRYCLCLKGKSSKDAKPEAMNVLDLHSDASSLMIWKFSTRQRKQRSFLSHAARHWQQTDSDGIEIPSSETGSSSSSLLKSNRVWTSMFADPTRPLIVDVGCGMGLSLLGLASLEQETSSCGISWIQGCNFVGVDLSAVAINFARGVASRWGLGRVAFVLDSAEQLLDDLKSYPGSVRRIMIQFPTPYRLASSSEGGGNTQLPSSVADGFMVTKNVLELSRYLLQKSRDNCSRLLIQSNCEDVAVCMCNLAREAGFAIIEDSSSVMEEPGEPTQRTRNWIEMGGERALGPGWRSSPLLPRLGRTETEIACTLNKTPVHRCVLRPVNSLSDS
jgi:SAM-dependent methyltransferase